jgi:hypothetical protein
MQFAVNDFFQDGWRKMNMKDVGIGRGSGINFINF